MSKRVTQTQQTDSRVVPDAMVVEGFGNDADSEVALGMSSHHRISHFRLRFGLFLQGAQRPLQSRKDRRSHPLRSTNFRLHRVSPNLQISVDGGPVATKELGDLGLTLTFLVPTAHQILLRCGEHHIRVRL